MKALTIRQPYASAIMAGIKQYETRSWIPTGGITEFAVHAGLQLEKQPYKYLCEHFSETMILPQGMILGVVRIVDIFYVETLADTISSLEYELGNWSVPNIAWQLEVVSILDTPIPAKGQLKFWNCGWELTGE